MDNSIRQLHDSFDKHHALDKMIVSGAVVDYSNVPFDILVCPCLGKWGYRSRVRESLSGVICLSTDPAFARSAIFKLKGDMLAEYLAYIRPLYGSARVDSWVRQGNHGKTR